MKKPTRRKYLSSSPTLGVEIKDKGNDESIELHIPTAPLGSPPLVLEFNFFADIIQLGEDIIEELRRFTTDGNRPDPFAKPPTDKATKRGMENARRAMDTFRGTR